MMAALSAADQDMGPSTSQLVLDPSLSTLVIGTAKLMTGEGELLRVLSVVLKPPTLAPLTWPLPSFWLFSLFAYSF